MWKRHDLKQLRVFGKVCLPDPEKKASRRILNPNQQHTIVVGRWAYVCVS